MGEAYISIILNCQLFKQTYREKDLDPAVLSRSVEEGSTLTTGLIPWTTAGVFYAATLGVPTLDYAAYALLNVLNPWFPSSWLCWESACCAPDILRGNKHERETDRSETGRIDGKHPTLQRTPLRHADRLFWNNRRIANEIFDPDFSRHHPEFLNLFPVAGGIITVAFFIFEYVLNNNLSCLWKSVEKLMGKNDILLDHRQSWKSYLVPAATCTIFAGMLLFWLYCSW